jgi:O-antigen/teichoic acid export membrane protein
MNNRFKEILSKGSILLGGSALAQLFTFLSYPVLSHWVTADKWATFGVFTAVVTLFAVMANGGYEQAILLPKENNKAFALWRLCKRYTFLVASLCVLLLLIKGLYFPDALSELHFGGVIVALFASVYFEGSIISSVVVLNRAESYKILAKGRALQAIVTLAVQLIMAFQWAHISSVLIWGWIAGQAIHFIWLQWHIVRVTNDWTQPEIERREVASEYKRFFQFSVASSYINTLSRQLPFLILPFWISDDLLGQFTFAHKILSAPLGLIGATITQVFNAQSSKAKRGEIAHIHDLTRQWSKWMMGIGLPILGILIWKGPEIFIGLFGNDYGLAGEMTQWLAPWLFLLYWISPLSNLISVENKLKTHFWYNITLLFSRALVLYCAASVFSGMIAISGYAIIGALFAVGMLIWLWILSRDMKTQQVKSSQGNGLTILFTGDVCISGNFAEAIKSHQEILSSEIIGRFRSAQAVCVNFEGPEFNQGQPRRMGESVTNAPGSVQYLSERGVNVFNVSNNHILDEGLHAAADTVKTIMRQGDACIGVSDTGHFSLEPHYICYNAITVALIAIEEGKERCDLNLLENTLAAVRQNADYIVLQYHGGEEYANIPFPFKRKRLERLIHLDIDAVIAHHPHVAQPLVYENNKWIAFSLGNFIFDIEEHKGRSKVEKGLLVEMKIDSKGISCVGIPVHIDTENAFVQWDVTNDWYDLQNQFYKTAYWRQWAAECNRIRREEARLTNERAESNSSEKTPLNARPKWKALFNSPRRSLFIGDVLHRLIFKHL